jgi:hypothetical protein
VKTTKNTSIKYIVHWLKGSYNKCTINLII